ncbi:MAG: metal-dependent hydrolase [Hyphomicrobiales bacterium]
MDTVTQIALGASVGQLVAGRTLGPKAMVYGAVGGLLPDLDVFLGSDEPLAEWKYHRGMTHSLWFGPVVGTALGWLGWKLARWRKPDSPSAGDDALKTWILLWVLTIFTHPLLDLFTVYGTQLLAPFSRERFAIPGVPIIDPVYTLILLAGLVAAGIFGVRTRKAVVASGVALALTTSYLIFGWGQNARAENLARASLAAQGANPESVSAYTTMFSIFLRRIVATEPDKYRIGFVSTLNPQPIEWRVVKRNSNATTLAEVALVTPDGKAYRKFASGPLFAEIGEASGERVLRLHDMRFGMPGSSLTGIWGAQWPINGNRTLATVSRFTNRPSFDRPGAAWNFVVQTYRAAFGLPVSSF